MTESEITQKIIGEHGYEIVAARSFVGIKKGVRIRITEQSSQKLFAELYEKACETNGNPIFVHSYYGYIWEDSGKYMALAVIEENYHYEVINFFVFDRLPRGKKISFTDYAQTVQTVKEIFAEHKLTLSDYLHYHDKTFYFMPENDDTHVILLIKPHSLFFGFSKKERMENGMTRVTPNYTRNKKLLLNSVSAIKHAVEECFIVE